MIKRRNYAIIYLVSDEEMQAIADYVATLEP